VTYEKQGKDKAGLLSSCTHKTTVATPDIKKDQELFISYIPENSMTRKERRYLLKPWIGTDCMCSRCVNEWDGTGNRQPPADLAEMVEVLAAKDVYVSK
jgi:hypothetical protein